MKQQSYLIIALFLLMSIGVYVSLSTALTFNLVKGSYEIERLSAKQAMSKIKNMVQENDFEQWQSKMDNSMSMRSFVVHKVKGDPIFAHPTVLNAMKEAKPDFIFLDEITRNIYYKIDGENIAVFSNKYPAFHEFRMASIIIFVCFLASFIFLCLVLYNFHKQSRTFIRSIDNKSSDSIEQFDSLPEFALHIKNKLAMQQKKINDTSYFQRDLMHGIAHEVKSPLAIIEFQLAQLADISSQEANQLISKISNNIDDLDAMISELLVYSRHQFSEEALNTEQLSLNELIENCLDKVTLHYPHVCFNTQSEKLIIEANQALFMRVIINLLRNAGRFAVSYCEINAKLQNNQLEICVEDDGPGIPQSQWQCIFEPFKRLEHSKAKDSGGVGLGLAICKSILKRHNAEITVSHSKLGGAAFKILFLATPHTRH